MEQKFLYCVARHFYQEHKSEIHKLCFVFPNRRSSIFFRKYLTQCMEGEALFAPKMITINDFFLELSGGQPVDKIEALYILYRQYAKLYADEEGNVQNTFDEFVYWGDVFLNDFDDIDKYLVDAKQLFSNIGELKKLTADENDYMSEVQKNAIREFCGSWGDGISATKENEKIDIKRDFHTIWDKMYEFYDSFREVLRSKGLMYEGMMYRDVAESLESGTGQQVLEKECGKYKKILFVGLNALNECEKRLFRHLKKPGNGIEVDFIWDYYGDIITDESNKSSQFMLRGKEGNVMEFAQKAIIKPYGTPLEPLRDDVEPGKINIVSVPSAVGQTRYVTEILEGIYCDKNGTLHPNLEETAIVLPDESLLQPMLNSIPECIDKVNVTMGYPLSSSHSATFISQLEELQKKIRVKKEGTVSFHHKSVIAILSHPFITSAVTKELLKSLREEIIGRNLVYVPMEKIGDNELLKSIFIPCRDSVKAGDYIENILHLVQEHLEEIDKEAAYHYLKAVRRLSGLGLPVMEIKTYFRLLKQIISVLSVPYNGEPLQGIQIMGPLETRALDFKNVIILSCNEEIFPSGNVSNSFIPYNLRLGFGLPTYEYQDSISAYHFYRSICRAEHIWLIYDSRTEGTKVGEPSRYIHQLKYGYNIPDKNGKRRLHISQSATSYNMKDKENYNRDIKKSQSVIKKLREKYLRKPDDSFEGSFSASTLNDYFKCQRMFYLKHVEGISEEDEVVDEVDGAQFGTIYHYVMEKLYMPNSSKGASTRDADHIESLRKDKEQIAGLILEGFAEARKKRKYSYESGNIRYEYEDLSGQEKIVFSLIASFVEKSLEIDREYAPFTFRASEMRVDYPMDINNIGTVNIKGSIDRVDEKGGEIRIIDYKTGSVDGKMLGIRASEENVLIDNLFKEEKNGSCVKNSVSFQLMLYKMMYAKQCDTDGDNITPAVFSLRDLYKENPLRSQQGLTTGIMEAFEEKVREKITEIFDDTIDFKAVTFDDGEFGACRYCNFRNICKIL